MSPKARSERCWYIAVLIKVTFKVIIGAFSSLGESVHTFANHALEKSINNKGNNIVLDNNFLRNDVDWQAHVFER